MRLGFQLEVVVFTLVGNDGMPHVQAMRSTSALELDTAAEDALDSASTHGLYQREGVNGAMHDEPATSTEKRGVRRTQLSAPSPSSVLQGSGAQTVRRDRSSKEFALKELVPRQTTIGFIGCAVAVSTMALCLVGLIPLIHQNFIAKPPEWGHDPSAVQRAYLEAEIDEKLAGNRYSRHAETTEALQPEEVGGIKCVQRNDDSLTEQCAAAVDKNDSLASDPTADGLDDDNAAEEPLVDHRRTWKAAQVLQSITKDPSSEQAEKVNQVLKRASQTEGAGAQKLMETVRRLSASEDGASNDVRIDLGRVQSCGGNERQLEELLRGASSELRSSLARMHSKSSLNGALSPTNSNSMDNSADFTLDSPRTPKRERGFSRQAAS